MSIIPTIHDERGSYTRGSFAILLCLTIITTSWQGAGSVYAWTNHEGLGVIETFVQDKKAVKQASDDMARAMEAAAAEMNEGRKAIDQQEWQAAIDRFNVIVGEYPTFENVDAAMYWLAYSLNKAGVYQDADAMVDRLLAEHAKSAWRKDAEALKVQIAAQLRDTRRIVGALRGRNNVRVVVPPLPPGSPAPVVVAVPPVPPAPPIPVGPVVAWGQGMSVGGDWDFDYDFDFDFDFDYSGFGANWSDDEGQGEGSSDDQIKCIALQALFESNPERAVTAAEGILKPDSKASPRVKQCAAMFLGQSDSPRARVVLVEVARNGTDPKLRKFAIVSLAQNTPDSGLDDPTITLLVDIASTSKDEGVAKSAVYALAQDEHPKTRQALFRLATGSAIPDVRKHAIFYFGQSNDPAALDDLLKIYQGTQEVELKKHVLHSISQNDSPRRIEVLRTIIRGTTDIQLLRTAIWAIAQGDCSPSTVDVFVSLYNERKEPEVRGQVIDALGQCDGEATVPVLINIAKTETSVDLRKKAVFWLGQKKSPAASKFLEELLTQP
jgi:HEAT repeat protein